jgi:sulfur carrier protein
MTPIGTIEITLNGKPGQVATNATVRDLVETLGASGPGLAVAVNDEVIRRESQASVHLKPGDRVEVIQAVGGG